MVYLHGCIQPAVQAAIGTRWDELADVDKFIVVYPQQQTTFSATPYPDGNGAGCWNWFLPQNEGRTGEAATIAGITRQVMATEPVDPNRVYIDGISAGAIMANLMAANYPDLYAALGSIAGCSYPDCADPSGAATFQAESSRARVMPVLAEVGSADTVAPPPLTVGVVQSWLGADDLADNGRADGSVSRIPAQTQNYGFEQTPQPLSGDTCIGPTALPCPGGVVGFQGTYPYTVTRYADAHGCDLVDFWLVHGLEHAYPGGDPAGDFTDPLGPNITQATYDFFMEHPMNGGGCARLDAAPPAHPGSSHSHH